MFGALEHRGESAHFANRLGSEYLRIVGLSYVLMAISVSYISVLRSITLVTVTMVVSVCALVLKTAIGYTLIFGHFGFPALGVRGAAIGTSIGWAFECVLLLLIVYMRKTPLAGNPLTFFHFDRAFLFNVLRTSMPATFNEVIWSFGITTYYAVYARIGTDAIAAININATIEELIFVLFIGLGNACSVMVGNKIGEKDKETAFEYSRRFTILAVFLAMLGGVVVIIIRGFVAGFYQLSPSATQSLMNIMLVYAFSAWLRVFNFMLFIGALRAGTGPFGAVGACQWFVHLGQGVRRLVRIARASVSVQVIGRSVDSEAADEGRGLSKHHQPSAVYSWSGSPAHG